MPSGRLAVYWLVLAVTFTASVCLATPAVAETVVPPGFVVTARDTPAPGVEHLALMRPDPPLRVDIARIAPDAPVSLRAVLSNDLVSGPAPQLERTTSMCLRVHCLLAVNADFGTGEPLGGLVTDGRLLRSPSTTHHQLSIKADGSLQTETFKWSGTLVPTDLRPVTLNGVNVSRSPGQIVLYTPSFGPTTAIAAPGADLVVRIVEPAGEFRLGQTSLVELVSLTDGAVDSAIPPDGAVLSGDGAGADALRQLWQRVGSTEAGRRALLRLDSVEGVVESVGGSPILIKGGKRWFADPGDDFTRGRHPRTLVGWAPGGDILLVTVDGRQPGFSVGVSLFEAADLLLTLGATEGMNLDGGGSTTFVVGGAVVNHPSDVSVQRGSEKLVRHAPVPGDKVSGHVERPVASALAVVPSHPVVVPAKDPLAGVALGLPEQALALPGPHRDDGNVVAEAGLPALVSRPAPTKERPVRTVAVVADALATAALAAGTVAVRRRLRTRRSAR